ncbi:hypothetical protein C8F04DRAFT_1072638 [Mycena alexandri]|uniref:Peptidase S54 rhomboid domain-containing protein n=1 Tax=Mycena alexandri TaxID=1745969 RepID=A0AAD6TDZ0_9AGAR|nr:hypothetical protein C8F04DRAFT_1072638 [Mycena alexandri]
MPLRAAHFRPLFHCSFVGRSPPLLSLSCRSFFRTAIATAKPKKVPKPNVVKPRVVIANLKATRPVKPYQQPNSLPTHTTPLPVDPTADSGDQTDILSSSQADLRTSESWKKLLFFIAALEIGVTLYAARKTNLNTDYWVDRLTHGQAIEGLNNHAILGARAAELAQTLERWGVVLVRMTQGLGTTLQRVILDSYVSAAEKFIQAPDAVRVCWGICAVNGAVFLAWRVPSLSTFMITNFIHHPLSGKAHTLLTSVFSHHGGFHLLFNSMALLSFGAAAGNFLYARQAQLPSNPLESTSAYHFLAFFISAGVFASLGSHAIRVRMYDAFVRTFPATAARPRINGSLGASGAIYACVTLSALAFPDARVAPLFVPFSVPIQTGVGALMLLDVVGVLRGWRMFDHIAHLSGAMCGVLYYFFGPSLWNGYRRLTATDRGKEK